MAEWLRPARCESGNCVEVAWTKSSYCVLVRDSKLGESSPVLRFTWAEWRAFVDDIGALDASLASALPSGT